MLKFEWNALRAGERVHVHDSQRFGLAPSAGIVAMIDTHTGVNRVGIRLDLDGRETVIRWPSYLAVHLDPAEPSESCWQCEAIEAQATPPPGAPRTRQPIKEMG